MLLTAVVCGKHTVDTKRLYGDLGDTLEPKFGKVHQWNWFVGFKSNVVITE